jgi:hypothetical protein
VSCSAFAENLASFLLLNMTPNDTNSVTSDE